MKIVLCSTSQRRIDLLKKIEPKFDVVAPNWNERSLSINETNYALKEATFKAFSVKGLYQDAIIIAADTIVVLNGIIYGKPKDKENALQILKELSGKTHEVITGYCILYKDQAIKKEITSEVTFEDLSDDQIRNYVNNYNNLDKAGAYAIQDNDQAHIIKSIKGSLSNIVGLPIDEIKKDLEFIKTN